MAGLFGAGGLPAAAGLFGAWRFAAPAGLFGAWRSAAPSRIVRSLHIYRSMLDPHWRTRDKHWDSQMVYCRTIRRWVQIFWRQAQNIPSSGIRRAWGWRIVLSLEIRRPCWWGVVLRLGIGCAGRIVLSLGDRRAWGWGIVLTLEIRRPSGWRDIFRLGIRCAGMSVLSLRDRRAWGYGIVLRLGIRRGSMLHAQWRTVNARWGSRLDLRRNNYRPGTSVLSLGDHRAWGWGIVLRLGIRRGSRYILGWPRSIGLRSILDNLARVRYSCCNTPLALRWCIER